ncbi:MULTISPECIES: hypothetical protein [Streptomyces]|uniref:hypothetical protein n=1 Tax=Streptomyces TaxID=1883 RepID=UPI001020E3C9|nr:MULTISPECIES: hypothetical protein [Streptomyces]MBV7251963.1 hypothetical protein [Streptomyces sp. S-2]MEE1727150.1 hypothetical protein [Streptomyces sp. JV186]RZE65855.1 hypothetical protein C0Q98_03650 [Streptomyces albidoflavus]
MPAAGAAVGMGPAGRSIPVTGVPEVPSAPGSRPAPAAGFSTAGEAVAVKDGFCQVGRVPPKALSATPAPPARAASWTGGSPDHEGTTGAGAGDASATGPDGTAGAGPTESAPGVSGVPPLRPRSRSRKPTAQPSARVTRDAI